ncbi:MAG: hypothetical protein H6977_09525 [Gammaproteobacteria bacterium]|nr:hypothetical protein [Gammaproteobacteria bacterium]
MSDKPSRFVINQRLFVAQLVIVGGASGFVAFLFAFTGQLGSFPLSFLAGCLGGSIALLRRLPRAEAATIDALAASWITTLMPLMYGGLMASVTYLLFMSGILTGDGGNGLFTSNLFPNFNRPAVAEDELLNMRMVLTLRPDGIADFGKLMVWCFVSGFSERFVMSVLGALEERAAPAQERRGGE